MVPEEFYLTVRKQVILSALLQPFPPPPAPLRVPELSRIKDRVLKQEDFTGTSSWQGLACSWPGGCLFVEAAAWGKARVCAAETLSTSVITKRILDWEKECQNIEATSSLNSNI